MFGVVRILLEIFFYFLIFELINFLSSMIYSKENVEGMFVIYRLIFIFWVFFLRKICSGRLGCCVCFLYEFFFGVGDEGFFF